MANLITDSPREVVFKELDKDHQIDQNSLKNHMFDDDFENIEILKNLQKLSIKEHPTLFYPGSGADIIFPCLYVEHLFPDVKEVSFHFMDIHHHLSLINTILDGLGISIDEENSFYWNGILIHLTFDVANVFKIDLPKHDIYFECAFRIMKDSDPDYDNKVFIALTQNGILISDSGFQNIDLEILEVPTELSSYKEMIIGRKNKNKKITQL